MIYLLRSYYILFIYPWITTTTRTTLLTWHVIGYNWSHSGADRGFQVRGAHLKNCAERREARNVLGYFVWKITILPQKIIFFPIAEGGAKIFGVFRVKNHDFTQTNHIFPNFRGARAGCATPLDPSLTLYNVILKLYAFILQDNPCHCYQQSGCYGDKIKRRYIN